MRLALLTAFCLFLGSAAVQTVAADSTVAGTGSVIGVVLDARGNAVPGAFVGIITRTGGIQRAQANRRGVFGFRTVPAEKAMIGATDRNGNSVRQRIGIRENQMLRISLTLK